MDDVISRMLQVHTGSDYEVILKFFDTFQIMVLKLFKMLTQQCFF